RGIAKGRGKRSFVDELPEALFDRCTGAVENRPRHIHEADVEPGLRKHLCDAISHRARTDDADRLNQKNIPGFRLQASGLVTANAEAQSSEPEARSKTPVAVA